MKKILTVVGARPQFVKAAVVSKAISKIGINEIMVHTGQHYDPNMSAVFFEQLEMRQPDYNLEVGSAEPAKQLSIMLERLSPIVDKEKPDAIHVYGDTNSTVAASIVGAAKDIPVIHTEAGERIFRRKQVPEEVNRVITDEVSSLNLTCTKRAKNYLLREGMSKSRVKFVGDPMYDLFVLGKSQLKAQAKLTPEDLNLKENEYHLATIHRVQNTADKSTLVTILNSLDNSDLPVVLPVHPRVKNLLSKWDWKPSKNLKLIDTLGYFDFLNMLVNCKRCFTDSGGVTREAFFAGKPCIVPMENSWWSDIVECGWMLTCKIEEKDILNKINNFEPTNIAPQGLFGNGDSASNIAKEIYDFLMSDSENVSWNRLGNYKELPASYAAECHMQTYKKVLKGLLSKNYSFNSFDEAPRLLEDNSPFVIMRHDIDFCLNKALAMAKAESELGIKSTYFFMLRTEHYNIFSKRGTDAINKILDYGHYLGLHFDVASYLDELSADELGKSVDQEAEILENYFKKKVGIVSFHRPNKFILTGTPEVSGARPHTYMPIYTDKIEYMSDSRGVWRNGNPLESQAFSESKPMHILIHPIWWADEHVAPHEILQRFVDDKMETIERSVADNNTVYQFGIYSN
jgi:UDP-GlcNAc3NAcA epimerase